MINAAYINLQTLLPMFYTHFPKGSSDYVLDQYGQMIKSGIYLTFLISIYICETQKVKQKNKLFVKCK